MKTLSRKTTPAKAAARIALILAAALPAAFAQQTAHGTLKVTGQVEGSIMVEFTAGSITRTVASGTTGASFTVPTYGGLFSQGSSPVAAADGNFLISSPFAIRVRKANLASASYTLKATLMTPDQSHQWKIDGVSISSGSEQVIAGHESYDTNSAHTLVVSGSADAPGSLANNIRFEIINN